MTRYFVLSIERLSWDGLIGFVIGFSFAILLAVLFLLLSLNKVNLYDLDHWKLNVEVPFESMWMNMGYWKTCEGQAIYHFNEACHRLLEEVLTASGLNSPHIKSTTSIALLDLGLGCGDQSQAIAKLFSSPSCRNFRYVGITSNEMQARIASSKLDRESKALRGVDEAKVSFDIFHADAAIPGLWRPEVVRAVEALAEESFTERWVLGLDSFYHFAPSREPIFGYAASKLNASIMAFDLTLNDAAPAWHKWAARAIGLMMGCPMHAFITKQDYKRQLVNAGFAEELIRINDITADVFPGLTEFIENQAQRLSLYGISLGKYTVARRIFKWFSESGSIRAVIVVARQKAPPEHK